MLGTRLLVGLVVVGSGALGLSAVSGAGPAGDAVFEGPVGRAECGPGSQPEAGLQGSVPVADRESGRSSAGYTCNLEMVGNYRGEGAEWQHAWYGNCAYYDTRFTGTQQSRGTQVIDVSDPANPRLTANLTTPAMLDPWESLKVNQERGLLGGVLTADYQGASFFDVYDVKEDCTQPKLLASVPVNGLGHEGDWSPDGKTYYATGVNPGVVTAIDVSDPANPKLYSVGLATSIIHGLGVSEDGRRLYLAHINHEGYYTAFAHERGNLTGTNGLGIYDISQVQERQPNAQMKLIGEVTWQDGGVGQHAIPITSGGRPYVVFVDEAGYGGPRIIDITDETQPRVVSKLKTEIQMPQNQAQADREIIRPGKENGGAVPFGYNTHYCRPDRTAEPTILVCSTFQSGVRVFDIRDIMRPREIAYFNPGGDGTAAPGGFGGTYSGYTSADPRILVKDGEAQLWFTDHDRGFYVVRFTNNAWPFQ